MELRTRHRFSCPPQIYWELTRSTDFLDEARREAQVDVEVLERRDSGTTHYERVKVSPREELPAIAQKALGTARLTYIQETTEDSATLTGTWKVTPVVMANKVTCAGTLQVAPAPGGCERIIEGEIKVAIPLVGGAIERHVSELVAQSYDRAADVVRRHLARRA
jgi:hypothetical protein